MMKCWVYPEDYMVLDKYLSKDDWLMNHGEAHGVDHMKRVLVLQELIADSLAKEGANLNREALRWAAGLHDLGRVNDWLDPDHGKRSGEWIKHNMVDIISPNTIETVIYLVTWHNIPDDQIPSMTNEMATLKDADALDRVRINDLDPTRLRLKISKSLIDVSQRLYLHNQIDL